MRLASFVNDKTRDMPECEFQGKPLSNRDQFCRIGAKGIEPDWLVFGDSHAYAGYGAFDKWLADQGKAGVFMFRNSCPPITGVHVFKDRGLCFAFNESIVAFLEHHDSIRNVLMVSTWRQHLRSASTGTSAFVAGGVDAFSKSGLRVPSNFHEWETHIHLGASSGARSNVPISMAKAEIEALCDIGIRK
jgi:hypothetical protein